MHEKLFWLTLNSTTPSARKLRKLRAFA